MERRIYLLWAMLLLGYAAIAQTTVSGHIIDAVTYKPLSGAAIYTADKAKGTTSDVNGFYSISIGGSQTLEFSFIGYKTEERKIIKGSSKQEINIQLSPNEAILDEVCVVAKSEAQVVREKALPVSVLSFDQLKGVSGSISDVVSKSSGVQVRRSGASGSQSRVSLRGLEGRRIGYFKDGVSLGNNETFDLNQIPVDFIERIEIYKGIVPAKFGGNAMGGAINMVMREYPPTYADIEYKYGSFNTHDVTYTLIGNKNGYEVGLGGGYTYSDNNYRMELPLQKGTYISRDHDKYKKFCLGLGFTSKRWWFDEVEFEPLIVHEFREIQGIEYRVDQAEKNNLTLGISNHLERTNFFLEGLNFEMNNSFSYTNNTFVDTASVRHGWDGTVYPSLTKLGGEIAGYDTDNNVFSVTQHTNFEYTITAQHIVNFNSQYNYVRSLPKDPLRETVLGYKPSFNSTMNSWIAGINYEYNSANKKFTNSLSGRFYHYDMATKFVPQLGLQSKEPSDVENNKNDFGVSEGIRFRFTPTFLVKASIAYDLRLPSKEELVGDGFSIEPSELLNPERSTSVNIGCMYDGTFSNGKRLQVDINVFAMHLEDMIKLSGGALQSKYENFGEMRTLGTELDIKWDAQKWLYLWGNITYQDLRDTRKFQPGSSVINATKDERIPNIPYFFWNFGTELHQENLFGGKGQNSRLYADCSFVEEYFYNFELSKNQEKRIPRSFTLNAGVEHSFLNRTVFLKFELKNISDEQVFSELNRPLPGRSFETTVRYIWK